MSPNAGTPPVPRAGLAGSRHGVYAESVLGESGMHSCGEDNHRGPNVLFP